MDLWIRLSSFLLLLHLCGADFPGLGGWSGVSKHPEALRMVAHLVYFTALQTRALLECFLDLQGAAKFFCFVIGFSRLRSYFKTKPKLVLKGR